MISVIYIVLLPIVALLTYHHLKIKPSFPHPPSPLSLPIIGHLHLIGPAIHRSFHRLSSLYGPLIRLKLGSTPCVVASTPEIAKELLKTNEFVFSSRKQSIAIKILTKDTSFAFSPYGPYWKFVKKMCTVELLGSRTLSNFSHIRENELLCFLQLMNRKAKVGEAVNVTQELLKLTNNVISEMMLSIRCSGTKGDVDKARTLVREVTEIFGVFNVSDNFWFLKSFDLQGIKKRAEDIDERCNNLLENIISGREKLRENKKKLKGEGDIIRSDNEGVKDFLDTLLDMMEDKDLEKKLTRDHIKALILDFFTAATDTTAITIEWALAELINNPKELKRAQEEIDRVVGKTRLVSESDGQDLPYIQAIIKETLRLHPPIPMISRKSIQDCTINGYYIEANTLLFVNIWSIGRNPKYWESPLDFKPDRFLGPNEGRADIKGQHFELLPFGTGRRGCPGISLAMQKLPIVLAGMIQCFEWRMEIKQRAKVDMSERPGLTAPRAHNLVCVPVARNDRDSEISWSLECAQDD